MTAGTLFHKTCTDLRGAAAGGGCCAAGSRTPCAAASTSCCSAAWSSSTRRWSAVASLAAAGAGAPRSARALVAVSAEQTPGGGLGRAHLRVIGDASAKTLIGAAGAMIQPGSTVKTDGWSSYGALPGAGYRHEAHAQSTPQSAAELLPWVHIVISNFKRWQLDVFRGVSAAHLQSYLDDFCYRLNRRDQRLDLFRRILNRCVLYTPPTTYAQLTARAT